LPALMREAVDPDGRSASAALYEIQETLGKTTP